MIEITFLGTTCMQPTKDRNHSGILLRYKTESILFDCGEGIQRQMRIAGIKPAKTTRLLISHWHGDHVFGIPGLLSSMGADQYAEKLEIYGPKGSAKYLEHMFKGFAAKDIIPYTVHEVSSGVIFENDDFMLVAQKLKHTVPSIGFSFIERDRRRINAKRAAALGLDGPILGKIQKGQTVEVGGKKVEPDQVSSIVPGKKVSYIADTALCDGAAELARDCDLLISEGTFLDAIKEKAEKSFHLTVKEAALLASENGAKKLVITHISNRYKSTAEIVEEARTYFDESVVAEDFMKFRV